MFRRDRNEDHFTFQTSSFLLRAGVVSAIFRLRSGNTPADTSNEKITSFRRSGARPLNPRKIERTSTLPAGEVRGWFWIANRGREIYAFFCMTLAGAERPIDEAVFPSFKLK